ncbi:hypothetical protein [Photobacterium toruni]|uniref:hypothetical protein n=1 Tax=Photobacterium toruni TaxID=1935446 RepID=UPI0021105AF4|nr:hypothetical protein [Photobacterium toruni]
MKTDKSIYIIMIVFILSFYAGQATNSPELDNWSFLVELSTVFSGFGSLGVLIIAYQAMVNWKRQQSQSIVIQSAIEVEDLLTKFYLACISENFVGNHDLNLFEDIGLINWRLRRRGFSVKELMKIEQTMSDIAQSLRASKTIPQELADRFLEDINNFSRTF